jgi:large subunit ribosomal protein L19
MNVKIVSQVESKSLKNDLPELKVGDTVRLGLKVTDRKVERVQNFEGILILELERH